MNETQQTIYDTIKALQTGPHKDSYDPEITGCGVGLWALSNALQGLPAQQAAQELRAMVAAGHVVAIDPDAYGLVSFIIKI